MKKVSGAAIKSMGTKIDAGSSNSIEVISRTELMKVAQCLVAGEYLYSVLFKEKERSLKMLAQG